MLYVLIFVILFLIWRKLSPSLQLTRNKDVYICYTWGYNRKMFYLFTL